jgi:c-di-GMP-binding flagellar brake protein YcgR
VTERRRFLRFETAISALCDIVSHKTKAKYSVKNISKEGALVLLDKPLREGEEINLSMDVPGDNIPIFASCEVAWQTQSDGGRLYQTGLKFRKIDGHDRGRLLEYIYLQWLKLLEKE